jgi:hypothetical protein
MFVWSKEHILFSQDVNDEEKSFVRFSGRWDFLTTIFGKESGAI